jgi:hypothetical protein
MKLLQPIQSSVSTTHERFLYHSAKAPCQVKVSIMQPLKSKGIKHKKNVGWEGGADGRKALTTWAPV